VSWEPCLREETLIRCRFCARDRCSLVRFLLCRTPMSDGRRTSRSSPALWQKLAALCLMVRTYLPSFGVICGVYFTAPLICWLHQSSKDCHWFWHRENHKTDVTFILLSIE